MKKRLCVVIVNYKTVALTMDCLTSLNDQLDYSVDHIVIVDNNSGGDDVAIITTGVEKRGLSRLVTIISSPANNGFSAGNNAGIKAVEAKYYLLTNSDTLFHTGSIAELLRAAENYPEAGLLSPRLEWKDGQPQTSCFRYHSPLSEFINSACTGIVTRLLCKFNVPLEIVEETSMPEWTSFACVLIRREVFQKIGYLDDGYFMYYEDVDFCRRAQKAGFKVVNYPYSHVVHLRGQSSGIKKMQHELKRLPTYFYHSRARYFTKFYGKVGFWATNLCWLAGRPFSLFREILFAKKRSLPENKHFDIWKH